MPMHEREHTCPHGACDAPIERGRFACRRHWFALPGWLRSRILVAYNTGDVGETVECYREAHDAWGDR